MASEAADETASAIYTEDELKRMSRRVKDLIPQQDTGEDDRIQVISLTDKLFATARCPSLFATHRVAAWNTLCAFIDELVRSDIQRVRELLWSSSLWLKAFDLYINDSQHARPKSAKQLLVTLGTALNKSDELPATQSLIIERATGCLLNDGSPRQTKAFLQLLTQFISKDLLDVRAINDSLSEKSDVLDNASDDLSVGNLLSCVFRWASHDDLGSVISRCISVVLDKHSEALQRHGSKSNDSTSRMELPVWSSTLDKCLDNSNVDIDQLRTHIFPILFKRSLPQYIRFLREHGLDGLLRVSVARHDESSAPHNNRLLLAALQSGKGLGLVYETDDIDFREDDSALYIPVKVYGALLTSHDRTVRTTGLSLLICSHSATRPFLSRGLKLLRRSLPVYLADTDANFRSEIFSLVQRLMDRLRAITAVLARTVEVDRQESGSDSETSKRLQQHRDFVDWLLRFLTWELRPAASYQRHISALKCLSIMARSGVDPTVLSAYWSKAALAETKWPFQLTTLSSKLQELLLDLLMDPFDDVRQTASSILSLYVDRSSAGPPVDCSRLQTAIERAERTMLATGRADQADGVARMYSLLAQKSSRDAATASTKPKVLPRLLDDLEHMLENARASLTVAAKRYPMHGILTSIRYILAQSLSYSNEDERERLIDCLHTVWKTVNPVLCNDAPEGYEHEDANQLGESSTKSTLSYCWRALKESSLLLGTVMADITLDDRHSIALGSLCFSQLAELRHRGAFSTVALTWIVCCNESVAMTFGQRYEPLHEHWYDQALDILKHKTTINTRRSAGIPSLICGLLVADKTGNLLARAFQDLMTIARETVDTAQANESSLSQVHALNCIKDILKNTRLGEQSEQFVPASLRLAADSLRSEAWAIRNCGLMLFRGVIDRLLGTSDAYLEDDAFATKRISACQHPELLETVIELLAVPDSSEDGATQKFEGVFPALQMLQRIEIPLAGQKRAQDAVLALTASPSWHVRDKAARTYAALVNEIESPVPLMEIFETRIGNENAIHGALLCLKFMTKAITSQATPSRQGPNSTVAYKSMLSTVLEALHTAWTYQDSYLHPVTRAAWIDTVVEYFQLLRSIPKDERPSNALSDQDSHIPLKLSQRLSSPEMPAEGFELACLARAFACQLVLGWEESRVSQVELPEMPVETILKLGRNDADACAEFWRTLHSELDEGAELLPERVAAVLLPAAVQILSGEFLMRLKCEVQKLLLSLADRGLASSLLSETCSRMSSPLATNSNQTYADQWLQLHALELDSRVQYQDNDSVRELSTFVATCKASVAGDSFFSREAAALAMSRMEHFWPSVAQQESGLACNAYLAIYDLLNDDEEDIRLLAASIVSRILRSANPGTRETHFEPIVASQHLLSHMLTYLQKSRAFATETFSRAFNTGETVVDLLHTYSKPDTALFAQEKQNLYIDPAREAKAWSQVLLRLPASTIPKGLIRDLTFWIDEGLYTLTSQLSKNKSNAGNGALGWTSKAETFVLGLQVVYGVEVLMGFVSKGGRLPMEGSEVVRRLGLFGQALEEESGGVLWRWEVERVLGKIVAGRVKLAWALAGEVRKGAVERS